MMEKILHNALIKICTSKGNAVFQSSKKKVVRNHFFGVSIHMNELIEAVLFFLLLVLAAVQPSLQTCFVPNIAVLDLSLTALHSLVGLCKYIQ